MSLTDAAYEAIFEDDAGRICKDIPESACNAQPENTLRHVLSIAATKSGDGLMDAKLVLAWLLGALGAPTYLVGLLVPLREAGALVPQLVIAGTIRRMPVRKWAWVASSVVQGLAVAGMGLAALLFSGAAAGWIIVGLVAVFALARSVASVSYKDVLGKTVSKSRRGTAVGMAGSLSSAIILGFGLLLSLGILERSVAVIAGVLFVAAGLWLIAALLFAGLAEEPGATAGGANAFDEAQRHFELLRTDRQLQRFIATRGMLIATGLSPPFLVAAAGAAGGTDFTHLGPYVIASGLASLVSSYVWGRLSDRSSRQVLIFSALTAMAALLLALAVTQFLTGAFVGYGVAAVLFVLMTAHQGVRLGRSTHITDMGNEETRAAYTALSNSIIGVLLLVGAGFGAVASLFGVEVVIVLFAAMCLCGALLATGLDEVQQ